MVERRARHELGRAQQRLHLVDGFLAAMQQLDAVVQVRVAGGWVRLAAGCCPVRFVPCMSGCSPQLPRVHGPLLVRTRRRAPQPSVHPTATATMRQAIRAAPDSAAASAVLQAAPFELSKEQAEGVLGLTLRRLTSLEAAKLREEQATLQAK